MKLHSQHYGKDRVRVMKVLRDGATHSVKELDVSVALEGDFADSYTKGDNANVVPTDTVKNTINVLAYRHLGMETEPFLELLARHFLQKYPQVTRVVAKAAERVWPRMSVAGQPHPHSFLQSQSARPFVEVVLDDRALTIESGMRDLLVLKSSGSGFEDYPRCEYTTLPETNDRILASSFTARWSWSGKPESYQTANLLIIDAMMPPFANNYSPSVQATLFEMGTASLEACVDISEITIAMPNKHCNLINLTPFGIENRNELFVPVDEPHGAIEATVSR